LDFIPPEGSSDEEAKPDKTISNANTSDEISMMNESQKSEIGLKSMQNSSSSTIRSNTNEQNLSNSTN
jgi:hypothetical protein